MDDENIILSYNDMKKTIKIPKDYEELEKIFIKEFNENDKFKFYFQYIDNDGDPINLDLDGYEGSIKDIKTLEERIIIITREDKDDKKGNKEEDEKVEQNEKNDIEDKESESSERNKKENEKEEDKYVLEP